MSWIESHQALGRHPKLVKLAARLRIHRAQAIGHLHYLWWWALDYAPTGDLSALTSTDIATAAEWPGNGETFKKAIIKEKWMDRDGKLHDWEVYAGRIIEARRLDAERKRNVRRTSGGHPADIRPPSGVPTVPTIPTVPNNLLDREENSKSLPFVTDSVQPPPGRNGVAGPQAKAMILQARTDEKPPQSIEPGSAKRPKDREEAKVRDLLRRLIQFSESPQSMAFYFKAIKKLRPGRVEEALGEVKMRLAAGTVQDQAAYLTELLTAWMDESG